MYVDASALVKLILSEAESPAFRAAAATWPAWVTSVISTVEIARAVGRSPGTNPAAAVAATDDVMDRVTVVALPPGVIARACSAEPASLRAFDAIHLGTALHLADGIDAVCTYDRRLAAAATAAGLTVLAPR